MMQNVLYKKNTLKRSLWSPVGSKGIAKPKLGPWGIEEMAHWTTVLGPELPPMRARLASFLNSPSFSAPAQPRFHGYTQPSQQ